MRITFRTSLRSEDTGKLVVGVLLLALTVPSLVTSPLWMISAVAAADLRGATIGVVMRLALAGVAWLGWTLLPPMRRCQLTLAPDGLGLRGHGREHWIPWSQLASLRIDTQPVARRIIGNGPSSTWHLVAEPEGWAPVAVPLDTFAASLDDIVAAFRRTAPDTVELRFAADLA